MKKWQFWLYLAILGAFMVSAIINGAIGNSIKAMFDVTDSFLVLVLMELAEIRNKIK